MTLPERAAMLGLGLIGGSIARELTALGVTVHGYDRDPARVDAACRDGGVAVAMDGEFAQLDACDLVVLAVPVDVAPALLARVAGRVAGTAAITDTGSTKRAIMDAAARAGLGARFVGSHPLAGDHRSGWAASRLGLFRDARVFLCAPESTPASTIARVDALWRALGAIPERCDAAAHDRELAWSSHLPHLVAGSLALALAGEGIARAQLGPGGRDMTRLAGSCPALWTAVARDNADALAEALAAAERELSRFRVALTAGDAAALEAALAGSRHWFDAPA